jgi:hypothetical protein
MSDRMNDLMTLKEIADLWRCSLRQARDVLVKMPGFPAPAPGSGVRNRVWNREDIEEFRLRGRPTRYAENYAQQGSSL